MIFSFLYFFETMPAGQRADRIAAFLPKEMRYMFLPLFRRRQGFFVGEQYTTPEPELSRQPIPEHMATRQRFLLKTSPVLLAAP